MIFYVILVVLSVLLTGLQQIGVGKDGLKLSFILVFLFLALRYDFGNDYMGYFQGYLSLESLNDDDFYFKGNEFGWLYLNFIFKSLFGDVGFHLMLACTAAFTCYTLYRFTIKYIPPNYYTFGMALFLLEPNNILVLSSAMRQSIAVGIFLLSFSYLLQRRYLYYTLGILLASLFHSSAIVFVVLILLNVVNWKIYLPYVVVGILLLFGLINNLSEIFNQINIFLESQESAYAVYTSQDFQEQKLGLGFLVIVFFHFGILVINRRDTGIAKNTMNKMIIIMLLLTILALSLQIATRLGFYVFPIVVAAFCFALARLKSVGSGAFAPIVRPAAIFIMAFFAYQNYEFWQSEVYSLYFMEYKTLFNSPLIE